MDKGILVEKEAGKYLGFEAATLRKWRQRAKGPAYLKLSGRIRYRIEDLDAWRLSCRVEPGSKKRRKAV
jgi:hypothetical protein